MSHEIITWHEVVVCHNKRVGWSCCIEKLVHDSHFVPVYAPLATLVADIELFIRFSLNFICFFSISGLQAVLLLRPGNAPLPPDHGFRTIKSLLEL